MRLDRFDEYSKMVPIELKILVKEAPDNDLDWAIVMYLFRHSRKGNIITLGKIRKFFELEDKIIFERLNKLSALWVRQYLNTEGYGKTYYTYDITDIACDLMIKLIELLEIAMKDKRCN